MQHDGLFEAAKQAFFSSNSSASPLETLEECVAPGSIEAFLQKCSSKPAQAAQTKPVPFAQVPKQADVQTPMQLNVSLKARQAVEAREHELVSAGHKK